MAQQGRVFPHMMPLHTRAKVAQAEAEARAEIPPISEATPILEDTSAAPPALSSTSTRLPSHPFILNGTDIPSPSLAYILNHGPGTVPIILTRKRFELELNEENENEAEKEEVSPRPMKKARVHAPHPPTTPLPRASLRAASPVNRPGPASEVTGALASIISPPSQSSNASTTPSSASSPGLTNGSSEKSYTPENPIQDEAYPFLYGGELFADDGEVIVYGEEIFPHGQEVQMYGEEIFIYGE